MTFWSITEDPSYLTFSHVVTGDKWILCEGSQFPGCGPVRRESVFSVTEYSRQASTSHSDPCLCDTGNTSLSVARPWQLNLDLLLLGYIWVPSSEPAGEAMRLHGHDGLELDSTSGYAISQLRDLGQANLPVPHLFKLKMREPSPL